jgi:hypothetical protein
MGVSLSANAKIGCGFWGFFVMLAFLFLVAPVNSNTSISAILAVTPTISASPSPSEALVVKTLVPQEEANTHFIVENNQVNYIYYRTLGQPCYYVLSGHVLDLNGEPFTNFVMNIKTVDIEGTVPDSGYAFPGNGSFAEDGTSGWVALLPTLTDYEIWLTTEVGGTELSPHIRIHMGDCNQNRAIVNFVQVRPLP